MPKALSPAAESAPGRVKIGTTSRGIGPAYEDKMGRRRLRRADPQLLLAAGALDVFLTPVQMKKNRPGTLVTVLCETNDVERMAELLLTHTSSFGVRVHKAHRRKLAREIVTVATRFGDIAVKIGRLGGKIVSRAPEYDSCRRAAVKYNVPVKEIYNEAVRAAEETK